MTFGKWSEDIHYEPEQLRRIERARAISKDDVTVDKENLTGVIKGPKKPHSKDRYEYYPTVESCTCPDFIINNRQARPCKHMYRLATECGLLPDDCSRFSEEIGFIENYSDEEQSLLKSLLAITAKHDTGKVWIELNDDHSKITEISPYRSDFVPVAADCILKNPFISFIPTLITDCNDRHIYDILNTIGKRPSHDLSGNDLVFWCKNSVPEFDDYLRNRYLVVVPFYRNTMKYTYEYIKRKLDSNTFMLDTESHLCSVNYPSGASFGKPVMDVFPNDTTHIGDAAVCFFPDDQITELLTLYGHNRCLNGFKTIVQ